MLKNVKTLVENYNIVFHTDGVLKYLRSYLTLKYSNSLNVIYVNTVFKMSM